MKSYFSLLLAFLIFGFTTASAIDAPALMPLTIVGGSGSSAAGAAQGDDWNEGFEGTGYELGEDPEWTEYVGTGSTVNPDASIPGTPPTGAGSQCLLTEATVATQNAYINNDSNWDHPSYMRFYVYVETAPAGTSYWFQVSDGDWKEAIRIRFSNTTMYFDCYDNGASTGKDTYAYSEDQWYMIDLKYDNAGASCGWKVNGEDQGSFGLTGTIATGLDYPQIGHRTYDAYTGKFYWDLIALDADNWIGE